VAFEWISLFKAAKNHDPLQTVTTDSLLMHTFHYTVIGYASLRKLGVKEK
jgi:hypothetical protein